MDQKTGIGAFYAEFFRGYEAVCGLFIRLFPSDWAYNQPYTRSLFEREAAELRVRPTNFTGTKGRL